MKHYLNFAIKNILHRKVRSWLTIIGIIVGIAAIVSLISLSQGLENAIKEQFEQMGSNKFYVIPKTGAGFVSLESGKITEDDVDTIEGVAGVDFTNAFLYAVKPVTFKGEDKAVYVMGFESGKDYGEALEADSISLEDGNWPQSNHQNGFAIIGNSLAHKTLEKEIFAGNRIEIGDLDFEVIGIMNKIGNEQDDNTIYISMDDARVIFDDPDGLNVIEVVVMKGFDIGEVAKDAQQKLERARDAEDVETYTPDQILQQLGSILSIVQIVLVGIAAISLFVGGIGIMNSMFTNVLERRREIGIMKAVGASPKNIKYIFMVEAGLMGLVGGIFGVILGSIISISIGKIAEQSGLMLLSIHVAWWVIVLGVIFAFVIGVISGYIPANNASKLMPVEALKE
jgi:putative ABC transport system permease protein